MKSTIFLLLLCLINLKLNAQPILSWYRQFNSGGNNSDNITEVKLDKGGNIYIAGFIKNSGMKATFLTVKYNTDGYLQWSRQYNCNGGWDNPVGIEIDNDGNVYVAGRCDTVNSSNHLRIFYAIIKYSREGDLIWIRKYINEDSILAVPSAICMDDSSSVYVTGRCSVLSPYGKCITVKYNKNGELIWARKIEYPNIDCQPLCIMYKNRFIYLKTIQYLIKYDVNGNLIWQRSSDSITSCKIKGDEFGNIYIAGTNYRNSVPEFETVKFDSLGNLKWIRMYMETNWYSNNNYLSDICIDNTGNAIITGNGVQDGPYGFRFSTIKYNEDGDSLWLRTYHSAYHSDDVSNSITTDKFGNVYITGSSDSATPYYSFATIKYSPSGLFQWSVFYPPVFDYKNYVGRFVRIDTTGSMYIIGTDSINDISGDIYIVKYSNTTGISGQISETPSSYFLNQNYPNPFNAVTEIGYCVPSSVHITISVYDILGRCIKILYDGNRKAGSYSVPFDASELASGMYIYKMQADSFNDAKKMLLIK